jgi:hypothetical protein
MASHCLNESARGESSALGIVFPYPFLDPILFHLLVRIGKANRSYFDPVRFGGEPGTIDVLLSAKG